MAAPKQMTEQDVRDTLAKLAILSVKFREAADLMDSIDPKAPLGHMTAVAAKLQDVLEAADMMLRG